VLAGPTAADCLVNDPATLKAAILSYPILSRSVRNKLVLWGFPGVRIPPYTRPYQPVLAFWLASG
jgi:hypothetical protein